MLISPTFLKVSESNTVTLADIKVTGYTPAQWQATKKGGQNVGGCAGSTFGIQTLTTSGTTDQSYYWLDYYTSATTKVGPGWFTSPTGSAIPGGEGSVALDSGTALWIKGSGLSLQPNGAVNPFDVVFKTATSGNVAIGNCMPVNVKLSDLTVTGYTPAQWQATKKGGQNVGGCAGSTFGVQTLTTSGTADQAYYWLDYYTSATTKVGPGWFSTPTGTEIPGGAGSVDVDAGKGLWVKGSGLNLIVPAPEL